MTSSISCNGIDIEAKSSVKYLGIMIDQFLSGDLIVSSMIKKVNQRLTFTDNFCAMTLVFLSENNIAV
jgi:hypothetical protein